MDRERLSGESRSPFRVDASLLAEDRFLVDLTVEEHLLNILKAEAGDGISEALPGLTLPAEQQDGPLYQIKDLLLAGKQGVQGTSGGEPLAPAAADVDLVAALAGVGNTKGTLGHTAATAVAALCVIGDHTVHQFQGLDGTGVLNLADLTAPALGEVQKGDALANEA